MSATLTRQADFRSTAPLPFARQGWDGRDVLMASAYAELVSQFINMHTASRYIYETSPAALTRQSSTLRSREFLKGFFEAVELSKSMVDEDEAAPLNSQTWAYAFQELTSLIFSFDLPAPLMLPLRNGGFGAEWHERGLNIELRFRGPYNIYAVLEDSRGIISVLQDYDVNLTRSRGALRELASREAAESRRVTAA